MHQKVARSRKDARNTELQRSTRLDTLLVDRGYEPDEDAVRDAVAILLRSREGEREGQAA
jgi:hypothetical protein